MTKITQFVMPKMSKSRMIFYAKSVEGFWPEFQARGRFMKYSMSGVSKKMKLLISREQDILNGFPNATLFCHFQIYPFPYSAQNETGKHLWTFHPLDYSKTELMTDL